MKRLIALLATVGVTVAAVTAMAAESYEQVLPVAAKHYKANGTVGTNYSAQRDEIFAINGAGMNADGLTHACDAANDKMWMCQDLTATFLITMATNETGEAVAREFSRIKLYNGNWKNYTNRGTKGFTIWYGDSLPTTLKATDIRSSFTKLDVGMTELPQATGTAAYAGETFDLPSTLSAKYVAILIDGNWGDGSRFVSLSEVQFFKRVVGAGEPFLPTAALVETDDGFAVTGVVANASATVGYRAEADDGVHVYEAFAAEPTAVNASFSLPVDTTGWANMQNYAFFALARNEAGETTNNLGRAFVGGLPTDRNVWVAQTGAADLHASVAANWSQGVPTADGLPLMFAPAFGDADVIWDADVNGLPARVPQISFVEYDRTFTVDSATSTVFAPRGADPFAVRHFRIGSTVPTAVELGAGAYRTSETVAFGTGAATGSSLRLTDGAELTVGLGFAATAGDVTVDEGALLDVRAGYSSGSSSVRGNVTTVRGTAIFAYPESTSPVSLATWSDGSVFEVDGGAVTNKANVNLNQNAGPKGSRVTVKNGGRMVNNGSFVYFHSFGGPLLVEVLSGSRFEINGTSSYLGCNDEGNNEYGCDVVVSNATWWTSCVCRIPRDRNGRHSHFTLVEDPGETASATFAAVELDAPVVKGESGFRTDNSVNVFGGTFTAEAVVIGSTGATADGTNGFSVARANSRVTFSSLAMYENSELRIALPAGGFILAGETSGLPANPAVKVTGTASFNERSKIVVDASEITERGTYTLLTAKTLNGFSTPEDVANRIVVKNARLVVEPIVDGKSVKLKFKTGMTIILR